jgi:hypothetical protein
MRGAGSVARVAKVFIQDVGVLRPGKGFI